MKVSRVKFFIALLVCFILKINTKTAKAQSDSVLKSTPTEEMASFPGGKEALIRYLDSALVYPEYALDNNIQGTVYISLIVKKDVYLDDIEIKRDIGAGCGKEAERVVKLMPRWNPGKINGEPVNVRLYIPVNFHISQEQKKAWKAKKRSNRKLKNN